MSERAEKWLKGDPGIRTSLESEHRSLRFEQKKTITERDIGRLLDLLAQFSLTFQNELKPTEFNAVQATRAIVLFFWKR